MFLHEALSIQARVHMPVHNKISVAMPPSPSKVGQPEPTPAAPLPMCIWCESVIQNCEQLKLQQTNICSVGSGRLITILFPPFRHSLHDCWIHLLCGFTSSHYTVLHTLPTRCVLAGVSEQVSNISSLFE